MQIKHLRWWIVGLLFCGTALNYIDRNVLAILEPRIKEDIHWTPEQWGLIHGGFWLAYAAFALATGRLIDKIGTKIGYLLIMGWWGAACALHGFAGSVAAFVLLRFALGMGESGLVPATAKACSEWFPLPERGFAYGLASAGMMIGGIITPLFVGRIAGAFGWQAAFFITGGLCAIWLLAWQLFFGNPAHHSLLTAKERGHILKNRSVDYNGSPDQSDGTRVGLGALLLMPQVWGIAAARFIGDPVWAFCMAWIPKYMSDVRGIPSATIENTVWLPFLAAAIASFASGAIASFFIKQGMNPVKAKKIVLILGAAMMPVGTAAFFAENYATALACLCATAFGHTFWVVATQTIPGDIFPSRYVGTVTGSAQMVSSLGCMLGMYGVGTLVSSFSYMPVFILAGLLHPLGTVVILLTLRHIDAMKRRLLQKENRLGNFIT
ncbi:MAG: MFS transporter [Pirellulales bacterium]|nr:MFS transporter [Pirellulales bacterium]